MNNNMPKAEEIREILKVLSDTVPDLLERLTKVLYGAKESEEYGKAVASFYKALKDAGMTNEQAFQLTKEYMSNLSIGNIMRNMHRPEIGEGMEKKVGAMNRENTGGD